MVKSLLEWASIIAAVAAAVWWFRSAAVPLPAPGMYWEKAPENDSFLMAIRESARLNGVAATLTAVSVLLAAVARLIRNSTGPAERVTLLTDPQSVPVSRR